MSSPEPVHFDNPRGQRLAGLVHRAAGAGPAAIVCHGMLSDKSSEKHAAIASELCARGVTALRFDFAGRGESDGELKTLTVSNEVQDLHAALRWVREQGHGPIGLCGSSLGGTVAVLAASEDPEIAAVVTINSPAMLADMFAEIDREAWKRRGTLPLTEGPLGYAFCEDSAAQDLLAAARIVGQRLLVVQGDADEVVDPADGGRLAEAALCDLMVIEGGDHRLTDETLRANVLRTVVDFLVARLTAGS